MTDQLPQFTQGDWVLATFGNDYHVIQLDNPLEKVKGHFSPERARLIAAAPKLYRALVALAKVAKVESDAEYRAVLDARDVIAEVMGS